MNNKRDYMNPGRTARMVEAAQYREQLPAAARTPDDCRAALAPDRLAAFSPSMAVRSEGMAPIMGEVELHPKQQARAAQEAVAELEQRREQLPTTAGMQEIEQRREQLPRASTTSAAAAMPTSIHLGIKMIRYRLSVGCKHQVTSEELKKVLIEESGVDKNNVRIINIQGNYTLVELPDEMPQDIFLHLKMVEVKQHKLDIKRVKTRSKKRGNNYNRRGRSRVA